MPPFLTTKVLFAAWMHKEELCRAVVLILWRTLQLGLWCLLFSAMTLILSSAAMGALQEAVWEQYVTTTMHHVVLVVDRPNKIWTRYCKLLLACTIILQMVFVEQESCSHNDNSSEAVCLLAGSFWVHLSKMWRTGLNSSKNSCGISGFFPGVDGSCHTIISYSIISKDHTAKISCQNNTHLLSALNGSYFWPFKTSRTR